MRCAVISSAVCVIAGVPARAQTADNQPLNAVLPATGFGVQAGTLQQQLERVPAGGGITLQPGLQYNASIGVDLGVTDNPGGLGGGTSSNQGVDGLLILSPSVGVSGETPHIRVNLGYSPTITRYAQTSSQNRIDQNLFGSANLTVVPEAIYINANANISQQSRTGGTFANGQQGFQQGFGTSNLNNNDQTQVTTISVTPFAIHRFGGTGTGQVGTTVSYTSEGNQNGASISDQTALNQAFGGRFTPTGPLTTFREFASFTTGEDFGRLNSATRVEATQYSGSGVYASAYRNTIADDLSYAITHSIAALLRIGYEDVRYGGFPPTRISDPIWRVGTRLTPNADSQIVLGYGHQDGINSAYANGYYSPTARTRVTITYSSGLDTDIEDLQNTTVVSQYDQSGSAYDPRTGGPISNSLGFSGIQNNLFKLRRASATGSLNYDRDTFALTLTNEQRTIVAAATQQQTSLVGSSDNSSIASLTWERSLTPMLTSSTGVSFGTSTFGGSGGGKQTTVGVNAALLYTLSPTVSTSIRYNLEQRSGNQSGQTASAFNGGNQVNNGTVNSLYLGLRKSF